jgi:hypothetical protein
MKKRSGRNFRTVRVHSLLMFSKNKLKRSVVIGTDEARSVHKLQRHYREWEENNGLDRISAHYGRLKGYEKNASCACPVSDALIAPASYLSGDAY